MLALQYVAKDLNWQNKGIINRNAQKLSTI